ncbi:hypothetical protein MLD38_028111 [Melastoma candidum]|uniref:Uncharacterized protein n=1 Tax=Melastoma candidum TaxID=119954 RepID=A0ACB9N1C9_9MYRT|nr:hypothetical protein MLD38_028111 [Melastoma candidum]
MDSQRIDNHVPRPLPLVDNGISNGGTGTDADSEDGGFVSAGEDVPDRDSGLGSGDGGFRHGAKISYDDDEEEEEGVLGGSRAKVPVVGNYDRSEEEEEVEGEGTNDGVVGEDEERRVFVGKKSAEAEVVVGEIVGEGIAAEEQGETDWMDKEAGAEGVEPSAVEVVPVENGISESATGGVNGPVAESLEDKVVQESFVATSFENGVLARDTESSGVELVVELPPESAKAEVESETRLVDSDAQPEEAVVGLGSVEHKSYRDVLLGEEKASAGDSKPPVEAVLPGSDEAGRESLEVEAAGKVSEEKGEEALESGEDQEQRPEIKGSDMDGESESLMFENAQAAKNFLEELEKGVESRSSLESSQERSQMIDGQIVTDSDEEDTDEEGDGKELFDSAALAALLKAATGSDNSGGSITVTSQDGSRLFSVERPAGLGSSLRSLKPAARPNSGGLFTSNLVTPLESDSKLSEEEKKKLEKIQQLRVKFLRLVQRLGYSTEDSLASQVLYRLALVAGRQGGQLFSLEAAKREAAELELNSKNDLNFSLTILVLGKAGVGKSATINSILGEDKAAIHAFETAMSSVKEITGEVNGVKIRVLDTPGLKTSAMDQAENRKVFSAIKKFTKKCPPDIVLYVDRLDTQTRDLNDLPLLKSITSALGSSIWRTAVVTLTHAASAPPDGPSGSPLSYDVFVAQRSHIVQQSIGQAVGDLRLMNPSLMNPVSLVENHPSCRKNRDGEKVLPNGQTWRPQLLLICYSLKILSEASSLSKPQDNFDHRKLFGFRVRSPPLPYLLSWLLQSRTHPKLSTDQGVDNGDSDVDVADLSDSDQEDEEDEYDQLPPFKPLRKTQIAKLSKEQRRAYFEEYDYRVKLLQKKQWREELRRMREIKKKGKVATEDYGYMGDDADPDNGSPAAVPVPLHDMVLPPSFDNDNPAYRYRFLEPTSQFVARPVLDTHGWDHDCGYDGVNLEHSLAIASQFPGAVTVQITKDKKEFNIHLDSSIAAKHGENGSTMAGFDIQNVGKQLAYIIRGESKFKTYRKNKTAAGFSITFLGENVATGLKVEDQITLGKRLVLVGSAGGVRSQGDTAYGTNLEVRLREADYPIGQDQSSLGLSLVKWRGDLALGANLQSQFSIGRGSKVAVRAGLNNKLSGQITVRTSTSDQLQIALLGILPVISTIYKSLKPAVKDSYSIY